VGGDSFKYASVHFVDEHHILTLLSRAVYFFMQRSPLQFRVCAIFQLSVDVGS
jgi:hypothetical protein